jgi:hypothetical protein
MKIDKDNIYKAPDSSRILSKPPKRSKLARMFRKYTNSHYWFEFRYNIKCFFYPQQEWLTDEIPNTFCDKVELIPKILFTCLTHYIEVECEKDHVHGIGYDWSKELEDKQVSREYVDKICLREEQLMKAYNWIKSGRDALEARIDAAYPPSQPWDEMFKRSEEHEGHYEMIVSKERSECYKEVNRLEAIKLDKDKRCMGVIIKYHEHLWT